MSHFQLLIEKILFDETFRVALVAAPAETLGRSGVGMTPQILDALEGINAATLRAMAHNFNESDAAR